MASSAVPVVTYQAVTGEQIDLTQRQITMLLTVHTWPRTITGREYARAVSGLHVGEPTFTDADVLAFCEGYNC